MQGPLCIILVSNMYQRSGLFSDIEDHSACGCVIDCIGFVTDHIEVSRSDIELSTAGNIQGQCMIDMCVTQIKQDEDNFDSKPLTLE